ncbi:MAG: hypothetical protein FWH00_05025, partial [Oscillospiraceae bacterium]|nr:hypothetical protein [Oscillospiraceae bacterium]
MMFEYSLSAQREDFYNITPQVRKPQPYEICEVDDTLRSKIQPILDETWSAPYLAINGKLWDSRIIPGYAAVSEDKEAVDA